MSLRADRPFWVCCALCLCIMPLLLVAALMALIIYAVVSIIGDLCFGDSEIPDAREVAQHICTGNEVSHL